jgi:type II restriction/modification system DNA methylase subunit YeeA
MTPQQFALKWRHVQLKERSAAQEHFIDLCQLLGHPTPAQADPTGQSFTFEAGVAKQKGGQGFADVWKRGCFAWEYKGKHADLDKAYQQLLQYREALENPPLLVVSDIDTIVIHTNFTNSIKRTYTLTLDDLLTPAGLDTLKAVFIDPARLQAAKTAEQATAEAAREFARLAELRRKYGDDPRQIAHFLIRLLFCLFAEDIDLLPKNLFTTLITRTRHRPNSPRPLGEGPGVRANPAPGSAFTAQLGQLFTAMSTGGWFGEHDIRHFDGGLFDNAAVLDLDSDSLDILARVSGLDWSSIEPSVLGTLFERSLDPAKRSQLGAHYTSKDDILLIVEPVLMAPLRRRWAQVQAEAAAKAAARDAAKSQPARAKAAAELTRLIFDFSDELKAVRVLDPASGSGNFLYVALKQLLDLWKQLSQLAAELGLPYLTVDRGPSPEQLYGIELNPYAHELAQTTVWIGYIQWLRDNGFGQPAEPILKPLHNIMQMDAILAWDDDGQPVEPEWPPAEVIIGNPPFLGDKKMRTELGDKYVDDLRGLYDIPGQSDLVCYWFEKARKLIETNKLQRAGLLATQGIRGGANRVVLERIKQTGDIFWAQGDRDWILGGATVHVSMVGFDKGDEAEKFLNGVPVEKINADLSSQADLVSAKTLAENQGLSFIGTQKNGPFDLTAEQARQMLASGGNPNGKPNSDVIKPWINALDVTQRPRNMWIIDFGVDMPIEEAALYEKPFEYIRQNVKPQRDNVRRKNHREKWWLFGETRRGMRNAISNLSRYIATPMVSKHRIFAKVSVQVIPENLLVVIAREDDYFFGVLHSKPHELWSRAQGTQLREAESGQRYTPSTTFETYPFPWPPGEEPTDSPPVQAIAQAAKELVEKRDHWLNPPVETQPVETRCIASLLKKRTLTNLYNQRPTWLDIAHRKLDEAVFAAYGWPPTLTDDELLARLLELNLARASTPPALRATSP